MRRKIALLVGVRDELVTQLRKAFEDVGVQVVCFDKPLHDALPGNGVQAILDRLAAIAHLNEIIGKIGRVDALINCVPFQQAGETLTDANCIDIFASTVVELSRAIRAVLPYMVADEEGKIITIAQEGARKGIYDALGVTAAAISVTHHIAEALETDNIRCVAIVNRNAPDSLAMSAIATQTVQIAIGESPVPLHALLIDEQGKAYLA